MENYFFSLSRKNVVLLAASLILLLVLFRFSFGGFNFSHFVVAGSDFVVSDSLHPDLKINEGQGYDGQFFYRYAHAPLNTEKFAFGVTVDHIEYRIQRVLYPATVWLFSMGGNPKIIPFLLVLFNVLSFLGLVLVSLKICEFYGSSNYLALLPLFLYGSYMSLARDTSELFEVFFFLLSIYMLIKNKIVGYFIFTVLAIFSRETSVIAIGPLSLLYGIKLLKTEGFKWQIITKGILLVIPFLLLVAWKIYLHAVIDSDRLVDGSHNLSFPFYGMYYGAKHNINFNDLKSIFEMIFWYMFFVWNVWFVVNVLQIIDFKKIKKIELDTTSILSIVYLFWLVFSTILGPAIYIDDWGFVRIFGLWNMLGFILFIIVNKTPNRFFIIYSSIVVLLLLIRLIIRV